MKVLLIPDKFKGSLSAKGVINAIEKGVLKAKPETQIYSVMASDGGDGFLNAVSENIKCEEVNAETVDPLGRKVKTTYLISIDGKTAYIELAKASGLELLSVKERNAALTSTYGTGLQIKEAIAHGVTSIYLGLGGSATNDGGMGIAMALGYSFLDSSGNILKPVGKNLSKIKTIEFDKNSAELNKVSFFAVNDVDNPLSGPEGAAFTYAKQKGADVTSVKMLDEGLKNLAVVVKNQFENDAADISGAGAAGGTAYGLKVFLSATFITGIDFVLNLGKVAELLNHQKFDYIITGEGKFDEQTLRGKLIKGIVVLGKRYNVPVIVVCGLFDMDKENIEELNLHKVLEIKDTSRSIVYSIENAAMLIERTVCTFFKNKNDSIRE